jgi:DNA-binding LacI/PurR family transcriptional regulator
LRRTGRIGVLAYAVDEYLNASYLRGLREGLPLDFQLLLCDTRGQAGLEAQFLKKMREDADAIVCFLASEMSNDELLQSIVAAGIPLVCLDRAAHETQADAIVSDNYGASVQAMRVLVGRGHRRIAHFTDHRFNISSIRERYEAHRDVMEEIGETNSAQWVRFFTAFAIKPEHYFEHLCQSVTDALFALMHQDKPPTAIFCMNDAYMAAVIEACRKLKIDVPGQLEIVSFNDHPPQYLPLPCPVLRIVQQPRAMGILAGERVARRLGGELLSPEILRVPAQLDDMVGQRVTAPAPKSGDFN